METSKALINGEQIVNFELSSEVFGTHARNLKIENIVAPVNVYQNLDKSQYDALQKAVTEDSKVLIYNCKIDFNDNVWDLSDCYDYHYTSRRILNFNAIPDGLCKSVKLWVVYLIRKGVVKLGTIYDYLNFMKTIFRRMDLLVIKDEHNLTSYDITKFLDDAFRKESKTNFLCKKATLQSYCEYLVISLGCKDRINLNLFDKYDECVSAINKDKELYKTKTIPRAYFNDLLSFFIKIFNDENESYENRGIAGIYIIMTQTGLRSNELVALTKDCLEVDQEINGKKVYKLFVRSFKCKHGLNSNEYKGYYTFANDLTVYVFNKLCELTAPRMTEYGLDFIYLSAMTKNHRVLPSWITSRAKELFVQRDFYIAEDKDSSIDGCVNAIHVCKHDKYVYIPGTKQFRVFLCSELYNTYQLPLLWIQKFMGHLSSEMQGYYVRPKDDKHKVVEESNKLLCDILDGKVTLLGDEGSELTAKIKAFIREGNYNVEKDIDKIFEEFRNVAEVTLKQDGFCTKKKLRRVCDWDEQVSQAHINFGKFLNNCHVYFMAARSYEDFKLLQRTFKECDNQGFEVEASRELKHLKALCNQRLLPELTDMMAKVEMRGYDAVVSDYPELKPLIDDYDNVYAEVQKWLKKQY